MAAAEAGLTLSSPPYVLSEHCHACLAGDEVVILDVRQDKYLSLDAASARAVGRLIEQWPVGRIASEPTSPSAGPNEILEDLFARGIITRGASSTSSAANFAARQVDDEFTGTLPSLTPTVRLSDLVAYVRSCRAATLQLRRHSFEQIVRSARMHRAERSSLTPDSATVRKLVGVYREIRPWFRSATDQCVFECLALSDFLYRGGSCVDWVFGVRTNPFAAHCWLQHRSTVLNDTLENVFRFTPIMII
jgi:hypothetical protein